MTRARFDTDGSHARSGAVASVGVGSCERVTRAALLCVLVLAFACADAPVDPPPQAAPVPARTAADHTTSAPPAAPPPAPSPAVDETEHAASAPAATPPSSLEPAPLPGYVPDPEDYSVPADATKVREVPGSQGAMAPVDHLLLTLEHGAGREVAEAIAAAEGGAIVGQVPTLRFYQLKLPTETMEELLAAAARARLVRGVAAAGLDPVVSFDDIFEPGPPDGPLNHPRLHLSLTPCAGREVAESVAAAEHARIVGQRPSMGLYQLELPRGTTVEQLQAAMDRAERRRGVASANFPRSAGLEHETPAETRARRSWGDCVEPLAEVHLFIQLEPGAGREVAESVAAAEGGDVVVQGRGQMARNYLLRLPIETVQELWAARLRVKRMPGVAVARAGPGTLHALRSGRAVVR